MYPTTLLLTGVSFIKWKNLFPFGMGEDKKNQCISIYCMAMNGVQEQVGLHTNIVTGGSATHPAGLFSNGQKSSRRGQEWD